MKRTKHNLSHYRLATFNMGELTPVSCFEVLPGDGMRISSGAMIRVSPLVAPVMHPVTVRLHWWYVPERVIQEEFTDFITGGSDGADATVLDTITPPGGGFTLGSLPDRLGIPLGPELAVRSAPIVAYNMIFNQFYRDQDLVTERSLTDTTIAKIAWEKDYFTAARLTPQKGPDVMIPIGDRAEIRGIGVDNAGTWGVTGGQTINEGDGTTQHTAANTAGNRWSSAPFVRQSGSTQFPDIFADLSAATGISVNDLRRYVALQRYQEARSLYGSRFNEYLLHEFGVRSSDARLQLPEYVCGGKQTIAFSEVLRTGNDANAATSPIGEMAGHGIAAMRSRRAIRYFEEHGFLMCLASVRPRSMYVDGLHRMWTRETKEDFYQRELEHIGQQEIYNREVYANAAVPDGVFGYGDRYSDYRSVPNLCTGEFRTVFDDWHLARIFASEPSLNDEFVTCEPSKRIHAVQTNDVLWGMFRHSIQARRVVARTAVGRMY